MEIVVVSFFPGNFSSAAVGGFDWWPDTVAGRAQAAAQAVELVKVPRGEGYGVTIVQLRYMGIDKSAAAVTAWVETETAHLRELPEQQ